MRCIVFFKNLISCWGGVLFFLFKKDMKAAKVYSWNLTGKKGSQLIQPFIWTAVPSLPQGTGRPQKSAIAISASGYPI